MEFVYCEVLVWLSFARIMFELFEQRQWRMFQ